MSWTKKQLGQHAEAAKRLGIIKDELKHSDILKNVRMSEGDGLYFIRKAYKRHGLVNDSKKEFAIVAFGKNTSQVHYFPKGKGAKLRPNTLILLDIWARLNKKGAPYADMTWMFYYGAKVPKDVGRKWTVLTYSRTSTLIYLKQCLKKGKLPRGVDLDRVAHDIIGNAGYGSAIKHTVGHSLGFDHPHGKPPGINWKEYSPLLRNVAYTIEPGMYFKDFGMRTEIDFFVSNEDKVVITTPMQKDIDII